MSLINIIISVIIPFCPVHLVHLVNQHILKHIEYTECFDEIQFRLLQRHITYILLRDAFRKYFLFL